MKSRSAKTAARAKLPWTRRRNRNRGAMHLIDTWMNDTSGYDERVWPDLKQAIEANRLSG